MPYRATIGGAFGGGAGSPASHPIDIGGALDSLTQGASTLIQNAYARKAASATLALNQQKADQEASRYAEQNRINEQRYNETNVRDTARYAAEGRQKRYDAGLKALGEGVKLPDGYWDEFSPAQTPTAPAQPVAATSVQPTAQPSISQSFQQGGTPMSDDEAAYRAGPQVAPGAAIVPPPQSAMPVAPTPPRITTPSYSAADDPRIKKAVALEQAKADMKLKMAPQFASADSAKTVNTARGLVPVHVAQAVATKQAEQPIDVVTDSLKATHKPLNPDESTATLQLPRMIEALNTINKLPPPTARSALTGKGGFWRNYLNSPEGQQFNQAATQAALSGALATEGPRGAQPDRVEYFKKSYVPSAGDSDAVAEQKLTALRELARGVKIKAGRGYERIDPNTRTMIESAIAGQPAANAAPASANPFMSLPKAKAP